MAIKLTTELKRNLAEAYLEQKLAIKKPEEISKTITDRIAKIGTKDVQNKDARQLASTLAGDQLLGEPRCGYLDEMIYFARVRKKNESLLGNANFDKFLDELYWKMFLTRGSKSITRFLAEYIAKVFDPEAIATVFKFLKTLADSREAIFSDKHQSLAKMISKQLDAAKQAAVAKAYGGKLDLNFA